MVPRVDPLIKIADLFVRTIVVCQPPPSAIWGMMRFWALPVARQREKSARTAGFDVEIPPKELYRFRSSRSRKTLREIAAITGDPEASVSARLRDFNNHEYLKSHFVMESERMAALERRGVWRYRLMVASHS